MICVAVPVCNEERCLPRLLSALAMQDYRKIVPVVLAINNSTDRSLEIAVQAQSLYAGRLDIAIDLTTFPDDVAHVGSARRRAGLIACERLGTRDDGFVVFTDADARPPSDWLTSMMPFCRDQTTIVGGRLELDLSEPVETSLLRRWNRWARYWSHVRCLEDEIDPRPWDPPARHGDHTGASLAISAAMLTAVDGVPALPCGEDTALVTAAERLGARLVHPVGCRTRVSARTVGRVAGGMATRLALMGDCATNQADEPAVPLRAWEERARWRRSIRSTPDGSRRVAELEAGLPPLVACSTLDQELSGRPSTGALSEMQRSMAKAST